MKAITVFSLIALISIIISQETKSCLEYVPSFYTGNDKISSLQAYSLDFCRSTAFSDSYYTCCFLKWKNSTDHHQYNCYPVNHTEMADIDIVVKRIEALDIVGDLDSLDCSSAYLYGSLLLILALLF